MKKRFGLSRILTASMIAATAFSSTAQAASPACRKPDYLKAIQAAQKDLDQTLRLQKSHAQALSQIGLNNDEVRLISQVSTLGTYGGALTLMALEAPLAASVSLANFSVAAQSLVQVPAFVSAPMIGLSAFVSAPTADAATYVPTRILVPIAGKDTPTTSDLRKLQSQVQDHWKRFWEVDRHLADSISQATLSLDPKDRLLSLGRDEYLLTDVLFQLEMKRASALIARRNYDEVLILTLEARCTGRVPPTAVELPDYKKTQRLTAKDVKNESAPATFYESNQGGAAYR